MVNGGADLGGRAEQRTAGAGLRPVSPSWLLPRRRRRPAVLVLGVVLAVLGGVVSGWAALHAGDRVAVLAVARPVGYGHPIGDADLAVARIASDAALSPVPAGRRAEVVGRYAAVELRPGMLLTTAAVSDSVPPAPATELVAVAVAASRMPASGLRPLQRVLVVSTPPQDGEPPPGLPATVAAVVVAVGDPDSTGARVVDVQVPAGSGPVLAARAATGRVGVVVEPARGGG